MFAGSMGTPKAVRLLHTSDWHVGRRLRGRSRSTEHQAVLAEIGHIALANEVDVLLLAGDVFETAAPSAESEKIVYEALASYATSGDLQVVAIAGNHDHPKRLEAVAKPFQALGVTLVANPAAPEGNGVISLDIPRTGATAQLALLPFVHRKQIVKASELMGASYDNHTQKYRDRMRFLLGRLAEGFRQDTANILMAHAFVGADPKRGAGEREIHFTEGYRIDGDALPQEASYVALGHLHSPQQISDTPVGHYCGTPMHLDFGHSHQRQVNIVDISPGHPTKVQAVPLRAGRNLRTLEGSLDELEDWAAANNTDDWLRIRVHERRTS